jgi:hypothetical protein
LISVNISEIRKSIFLLLSGMLDQGNRMTTTGDQTVQEMDGCTYIGEYVTLTMTPERACQCVMIIIKANKVWGTTRMAQTDKINILISILFHVGDH